MNIGYQYRYGTDTLARQAKEDSVDINWESGAPDFKYPEIVGSTSLHTIAHEIIILCSRLAV